MAEGHSVFLTGPAGSGKTYVLNQFVRYAKAHGKKVAVTAKSIAEWITNPIDSDRVC